MNVILTEAAYADLLGIGRVIGRDNPARVESFVAELMDRCGSLTGMSRAYPLFPNREESGIRRRVHGNYLIFNRINGETVEWVHVLHGAMNYEQILFQDG